MSSRAYGLPRAWALRANFASGRNCCGLEIDQRFRARTPDPASPPISALVFFFASMWLEAAGQVRLGLTPQNPFF